jgi:1-deoxy-D-xylulose-5-phosphate reductoisomerase
MRRVVVLGSSGSIGTQTLDIIAQHPDRLQVVGLAAHSNSNLLAEQAARFRVSKTALTQSNPDGLVEIATMAEADIVVVAVAGVVGLLPTIEAIRAGKDIALASKEVLVAAGEVVMPLVRERGVALTPIDSEHSAIFQCLQGYEPAQIESLILTASGGPFRGRKRAELERITVDEALNHPTWRMGGKITIDSATLMNKGLETIEAKWLFDVEIDQVETVVHPQSIIHSMVKLRDGSVLGQLGWPNMRLPIQYALLYPDRVPNELPPWSPLDSPSLTFEPVDHETFPSIEIAKRSVRIGGTAPCAMNAANEEAANAFLKGRVSFLAIPEIVGEVLARHDRKDPTLDNLLETDAQSREIARRLMESPEN